MKDSSYLNIELKKFSSCQNPENIYQSHHAGEEGYVPQFLEHVIKGIISALDKDQYQIVAEAFIENELAFREAPNKQLKCSDWMVDMGYAANVHDFINSGYSGDCNSSEYSVFQERYVTKSGWVYVYNFIRQNLSEYI